MRDPQTLQTELDRLVVELDSISKDQDEWATKLAAAQNAWEEIFDRFSEELQSEYDEGEHKGAFPGQERLDSMCRRASSENREVWRSVRRAEHMLEKRSRRASNIKQEIGGLQSILKTLTTELQAIS